MKLVISWRPSTQGKVEPFIRRWRLGRVTVECRASQIHHFEPGEDKRAWKTIPVGGSAYEMSIGGSGSLKSLNRIGKNLSQRARVGAERILSTMCSAVVFGYRIKSCRTLRSHSAHQLTNANELHRLGPAATSRCEALCMSGSRQHGCPEPSRHYLQSKNFRDHVKALAKTRWPGRGPGSAKQPVHYPQDELDEEVRACSSLSLDPSCPNDWPIGHSPPVPHTRILLGERAVWLPALSLSVGA